MADNSPVQATRMFFVITRNVRGSSMFQLTYALHCDFQVRLRKVLLRIREMRKSEIEEFSRFLHEFFSHKQYSIWVQKQPALKIIWKLLSPMKQRQPDSVAMTIQHHIKPDQIAFASIPRAQRTLPEQDGLSNLWQSMKILILWIFRQSFQLVE